MLQEARKLILVSNGAARHFFRRAPRAGARAGPIQTTRTVAQRHLRLMPHACSRAYQPNAECHCRMTACLSLQAPLPKTSYTSSADLPSSWWLEPRAK